MIAANRHLTIIVLLEYIDLFTKYMNIYYSVDIILNVLPSSQLLKYLALSYKSCILLLYMCV